MVARKRRLPANANVARGAWRPRESRRRHGADIVPHLVNEEEEGDRAERVPPRNFGNFTRTPRWSSRGEDPDIRFSVVDRLTSGCNSGPESGVEYAEQGGC